MTDRQRLLVALLSRDDNPEADVATMRALEMLGALDLVGPISAPRAAP